MVISIRKDDIYRPTKEKITPNDSAAFFSESYNRAFKLVANFENALDNSKREYEYVKNIIMISSDRGQGKTSALYSIREFLCDGELYKEEEIKRNQAQKKDQGIRRKYIYMDPAIDPSSLNKNEPLIRTVISYLYKDFGELIGRNDNSQISKIEIRETRECFSKCYKYIDMIYGNRRSDDLYYDDDIENLSALGSSLDFRKELEKLIGKYLSIYQKISFPNDTEKMILVISIDDVDLAVGKAFDVCEAIRNYLSCSNILVLMAADVDQLENAIEQNYIGKYENLLKNQVSENDKFMYLAKCREMSTRYIEKVFPRGCRIDLPTIDSAIAKNSNIRLKLDDLLDKDYKSDDISFQAFLLKVLYDRTGIVFFLDENYSNPILPSTMRELTHFVKMLDDMELTGINDSFKDVLTTNESMYRCDENYLSEIDKALRNIKILKAQFVGYWTPIHLSERYQTLIEDVTNLSIDNYTKELKKRIKKESDLKVENEDEEQTFIQYITLEDNCITVNKTEQGQESYEEIAADIVDALRLSYTLSANEWFLMALKDNNFDKLRKLIEHSFYLKHNNAKYAKKYHLFRYVCRKEDLELYYNDGDKIDGDTKEWLMSYGKIKQREDDYPDYFADSEEQDIWDYNRLEEIRVNVFDVILNMLNQNVSLPMRSGETFSNVKESEEENITEQEDISVSANKSDNQRVITGKSYLEVRNILVNSDVQRHISSVIDDKLRKFESRHKTKSIEQVYTEIGNAIESAIRNQEAFSDADYSSVKSALVDSASIASRFILINSDNAASFVEELIDEIKKFLDNEISILEKISDAKQMAKYASENRVVPTPPFENDILSDIYGICKKNGSSKNVVSEAEDDKLKAEEKEGTTNESNLRYRLEQAIYIKDDVENKIKKLVNEYNQINFDNEDNQIKVIVDELKKTRDTIH